MQGRQQKKLPLGCGSRGGCAGRQAKTGDRSPTHGARPQGAHGLWTWSILDVNQGRGMTTPFVGAPVLLIEAPLHVVVLHLTADTPLEALARPLLPGGSLELGRAGCCYK